jgi:phage terminase large subunit
MPLSSTILRDNANAYKSGHYRLIANKGGTRSSKTFSILQLLLSIAYNSESPLLISVVSESFPHLKRGAMRDFAQIIDSVHLVEDKHYTLSLTDHIYKFAGGGSVEFFSADNATKVHGAQRDILFINECNHVNYEIYRQLVVRTSKCVFLDWNPTSRFWYEEKGLNTRKDTKEINSTYTDNPFLSAQQIAEIESNKSDENWWRVYGLGEVGSVEGLIYSNWDIVEKMPSDYKRRYFGIDFGFTNDPTAIVEIRLQGGELYVDEIAYNTAMNNVDIAKRLQASGVTKLTDVVADSAEPKSIAEINAQGLRVLGADKGKGTILAGIQILQRYKVHVTNSSLGIISELRNYMWKRDNDGNWLNEPTDRFNHALDAMRYVALQWLAVRRQVQPPKAQIFKLY